MVEVKKTAMIRIANRSSTTASVSRNARSAPGSAVPMTASTASANAMSVAVGRPSPERTAAGDADQRVDERRDGHAAERGDDGERGGGGGPQLAGDELALEFDAGDEEEDGEQSVGRPVRDGQVQPERRGAEDGSR